MTHSEALDYLMRLYPNVETILEQDDLFYVRHVGDESVDHKMIVWTWQYDDGVMEIIDANIEGE